MDSAEHDGHEAEKGMLESALTAPTALADPDVALVRRMADGDEASLRALFASHGQRLFAYAYRLTGSQATAEEVVQDSLLASWRGARSFRGDSRVAAWLLGIVYRQAHSAVRRKRHPAVSLDADDGAPEPEAPDPRPDEAAAEGDRKRAIAEGLSSLSPEHREVLELVFYQGLSLAEVAEVTKRPVGTVKSRLSYAKTQLRAALGRGGHRREDLL